MGTEQIFFSLGFSPWFKTKQLLKNCQQAQGNKITLLQGDVTFFFKKNLQFAINASKVRKHAFSSLIFGSQKQGESKINHPHEQIEKYHAIPN
jgi:hypothetical protein